MKIPLYLTTEGILYKKEGTICFQNKEIKKVIPVNIISEIYCFARITVKSGALYHLFKLNIPVHFFNKYGNYVGSIYPKTKTLSGKIIIEQVKHYLQTEKRMFIAKEIIEGLKYNIIKTLSYYEKRGKHINIEKIKQININNVKSIKELLATEGKLWNIYYNSFNIILKKFKITKRKIRPPSDEINSMISFGNSLLYGVCLTEIYNTYLNPLVSYLHEPGERRYSLALDIAELFKPAFVGRSIFYLVNKGKINEKVFKRDGEGVFLNKRGKRIFVEEFNKKLKTVVTDPLSKRKFSYRRLIRIECYKLLNHITGKSTYKSFRMWW